MDKGRKILTDPNAASANESEPAFIARPEGAPIYHGFVTIEESDTDGWKIGAITEFIGEEYGDAFVIAPDGSRAGLVWEVGPGEFASVCEPSPGRWGVFAVWFPSPIHSTEDLISNFRTILPDLKRAYNNVNQTG